MECGTISISTTPLISSDYAYSLFNDNDNNNNALDPHSDQKEEKSSVAKVVIQPTSNYDSDISFTTVKYNANVEESDETTVVQRTCDGINSLSSQSSLSTNYTEALDKMNECTNAKEVDNTDSYKEVQISSPLLPTISPPFYLLEYLSVFPLASEMNAINYAQTTELASEMKIKRNLSQLHLSEHHQQYQSVDYTEPQQQLYENISISSSTTFEINSSNSNTLFSNNNINAIGQLYPDSDEDKKSRILKQLMHDNGTSYTKVNSNSYLEEIPEAASQPKEKLKQYSSTYANASNCIEIPQPANKKRKLSQQKRDRECQKRNYKYSEGKDIINGSKATDDEINEYEEFIKETVFCKCCTKEVSVKNILLFNDEIYCMNCLKQLAKEGEIDMKYLKKDYFESKNYDEKEMEGKLFKCQRSKHSRPVSHFIELIKGVYQFVTNCSYCRNYKAIYYVVKKYKK